MKFLLDTNVVSEWVKPRPNAGVVAWLARVDEASVYLSVITLMELRYGIDCMSAGRRRARLEKWLREQLPQRFEERVLEIDSTVADTCGALLAKGRASGQRLGSMDAFIGATAIVHGLKLVTRNVRDFKFLDGQIVNPWH